MKIQEYLTYNICFRGHHLMKSSNKDSGIIENKTRVISSVEAKDKKHKKNRRPASTRNTIFRVILLSASLLTLAAILFTAFYWFYQPGTNWADDKAPEVIFNDTPFKDEDYVLHDGALYLKYETVKEFIDSSIFYDSSDNRVIVTTADKVIEMDVKLLTININYQPVLIDTPLYIYNDNPYVSMDFLSPIYDLKIEYLPSGVVLLDNFRKAVIEGKVSKSKSLFPDIFLMADSYLNEGVFLRKEPAHSALRIKELMDGDKFSIYSEKDGWYRVRTHEGILGYINKNNTHIDGISENIRQEKFFSPPWRPLGEKINLTWDQIYSTRQDMSAYTSLPGVNVISPTWFHIADAEGNITSYGSKAYVDWAHSEGLQVWALFSNNFDSEMTSVILRNFELRKKVITQIMVLSELLGIDGVNIDFEDVNYADQEYLTQFVREITPMLRELGLTVSMDVTIRSSSPNWSMVYDRPELSKIVDYMAVMTYDEHWASSPVAGSVASIPWVRLGVERILEQIPPHKLLLGVPFYSRVWEEETLENGEIRVRSSAYSMSRIKTIIEENQAEVVFDETTGQNYAEYMKDGKRYRIWIEDEISMRSRIKMVHEFNLAGLASWSRGFEEPHIWDVILEELSFRS